MTSFVRFPNGETYPNDGGLLWRDAIERGACEVLKGEKGKQARRDFLRGQLLKFIAPKANLKVICTKHGQYPATSHFKVLAPRLTDEGAMIIADITGQVAALCGLRLNKQGDAIVMGGCGYSKSFQIVYDLGRALWPNGTPEPHGMRNGEPDSDGGYALGY